tara:strand:- start:147 stop:434 length:288 start_codon:yes stop_codon:yes gene_type:complete
MTQNINYQLILEEEVNHLVRENAGFGERFYELSNENRLFLEAVIDAAYGQAISDALNTEVLNDTAELSAEMGTQLYNFANMLQTYLNTQDDPEQT